MSDQAILNIAVPQTPEELDDLHVLLVLVERVVRRMSEQKAMGVDNVASEEK
jgi:hypothetical protein